MIYKMFRGIILICLISIHTTEGVNKSTEVSNKDVDAPVIPEKMYDILYYLLQTRVGDLQRKEQTKDLDCRITALENKLTAYETGRNELERNAGLNSEILKLLLNMQREIDSLKNTVNQMKSAKQAADTCEEQTGKIDKLVNNLDNVELRFLDVKNNISVLSSEMHNVQLDVHSVNPIVSLVNETVMQLYTKLLTTDQMNINQVQNLSASFDDVKESLLQDINESKDACKEIAKNLSTAFGNSQLAMGLQINALEEEIFQLKTRVNVTDNEIKTLQLLADLPDESLTCQESWREFNGHCYFVSDNAVNWQSAADACRKIEGHLVIVESEDENVFLQKLAKERKVSFWLDGTDAQKESNWISGSTGGVFTFTDWLAGDPDGGKNQNCLVMHKSYEYKWVDAGCNNLYTSVCERE